MEPAIIEIHEKKLAGKHLKMSMSENKTFDLWRSFMPERSKIKNTIGINLYSLQVYKNGYDFTKFDPQSEFEKWAAVEVREFENIPEGIETLILNAGLYAVFIHKGPASSGAETFRYIFESWLPNSEYHIDNRPHFEILGDKYKNESPDSEEEIWIPVRIKPEQ